MIYLSFVEPTDPDWIQWINDCNEETRSLVQSHINGNPKEVIDSLYKRQKHRYDDYPFFGKCAYCESKIEENSPTYVEHFRPKGGVRNFDNDVVRILKNDILYSHPGYYWLAYDWRNLLPTCWKCNTWHEDRKTGQMIGKGNRFPVIGKHAENPGEEVNENSELIMPILDDPKDHIYMDEIGVIHKLPNSSKASTTIKLFGLNIREAIVNARKKEYENIRRKVQALFTSEDTTFINNELAALESIKRGGDEFTIAAKKAIADVISHSQQINNNLLDNNL